MVVSRERWSTTHRAPSQLRASPGASPVSSVDEAGRKPSPPTRSATSNLPRRSEILAVDQATRLQLCGCSSAPAQRGGHNFHLGMLLPLADQPKNAGSSFDAAIPPLDPTPFAILSLPSSTSTFLHNAPDDFTARSLRRKFSTTSRESLRSERRDAACRLGSSYFRSEFACRRKRRKNPTAMHPADASIKDRLPVEIPRLQLRRGSSPGCKKPPERADQIHGRYTPRPYWGR